MPSFTTPVTYQSSDDPFFGRWSLPVGTSVVWNGTNFVEQPYPWLGDIIDLTEGETWFGGGRTFEISEETAAQLIEDGFDVDE